MEEVATIEAGTVDTTQSEATETAAAHEVQSAQAEPAGQPDVKALLKREKDDPNVVFTDAELDALEAHWSKGDNKTKSKAPEPKEEPEADEPEETPEQKPKAEPKEEPEEEPEAEEADQPDPQAKAILKELGAKDLKDAAAKLKDLKRLVGGKDAQAVARVTKEKEDLVRSGKELWTALRNGDSKAMEFAEKTFGVKFAGKGQEQPKAPAVQGERFIDPAKFIDPESADLVEAAFQRQANEIKALKDSWSKIEAEREQTIKDNVARNSIATVVDEMADVASRIPELKALTGFREAAQNVLNGKPDPRLDVFTELFEIAEQEKCSLRQAYFIKRGKDSDRIEAQAIEKGRKEAYNQKPNPSLSGVAGGKGEAAYQPVTDADLERWENDHRTHPSHWYDKEGNLLQFKVPKRAWKIFDFK